MAGGAGERFWPLSRKNRPKQLLNLTDPSKSLLEESVGRIAALIPPEQVFVATGRHLQAPIRAADLPIPDENVIAEPCKRNTAGCLVYAAAVALARFDSSASDLTMAVVTADHQIGEVEKFLHTVEVALAAAETEQALVTIGIKPTRAATGYGYIEIPEGAVTCAGSSREFPVYKVASFHEKPDLYTANQYLESGRFLWNSGMFFWTVSAFLSELDQTAPQYAETCRQMQTAIANGDEQTVEEVFAALPGESIDYVLMEHARNVLVTPGTFPWDDVGSWDALERTFPHDGNGNVTVGDPVLVESSNCIVYNEPGADQTAVAIVGCEDLVVVTTKDGMLVVPKERVQGVRAAVKALKERNASQL